jgi:ABC-3C protein
MDNYDRQVLSLTDEELERFVRDWVGCKGKSYFECARFSGAGDMGRDVVGFLSTARHEGDWHNYQCKQYGKTLPTESGIREIGKVLYYAYKQEFTAPAEYFFVTPKGVNRNLEKLIFNPSIFKATLISDWDKYCGNGKIVQNQNVPLDAGLKIFIEAYDFSRVKRMALDDILNDPHVKPVLTKWFGADPGPAPKGKVPATIQIFELPYISQLIEAYADRDGKNYSGHTEIENHQMHGPHLARQRERFHDAEAFKRFYRDNTEEEVLKAVEDDVYHGVADICDAGHQDKLSCVEAVMTQAANTVVSGLLAKHTRVPIKQGICHHFVNENRLRWRR